MAELKNLERQSFAAPSSTTTDENFNFDLWAVAVRRQMLAALKKREGVRANWG